MTLSRRSDDTPTASASTVKGVVAGWGRPNGLPVPDAVLAAAFATALSSAALAPTLFVGTAHGKVLSYSVCENTGNDDVVVTLQRSFQCSPDPSQLL